MRTVHTDNFREIKGTQLQILCRFFEGYYRWLDASQSEDADEMDNLLGKEPAETHSRPGALKRLVALKEAA